MLAPLETYFAHSHFVLLLVNNRVEFQKILPITRSDVCRRFDELPLCRGIVGGYAGFAILSSTLTLEVDTFEPVNVINEMGGSDGTFTIVDEES